MEWEQEEDLDQFQDLSVLFGQSQIRRREISLHDMVKSRDIYRLEEGQIAATWNYKGCFRYEHDPVKIQAEQKDKKKKRRNIRFSPATLTRSFQQKKTPTVFANAQALRQDRRQFFKETWANLRRNK